MNKNKEKERREENGFNKNREKESRKKYKIHKSYLFESSSDDSSIGSILLKGGAKR